MSTTAPIAKARDSNASSSSASSCPVQVIGRLRPLSEAEMALLGCVSIDDATIVVKAATSAIDGSTTSQRKEVTLDSVVGPDATQQTFYEQSGGSKVIERALDGYNSTVFAYGQTGSGKTHSMIGPNGGSTEMADELGYVPRMMQQLFQALGQVASPRERSVKVEMQVFELYGEEVYDLSQNTKTEVEVSDNSGMHLERIAATECYDAAAALKLLAKGMQKRAVGETDMNAYSSRSHFFARVTVSQTDHTNNDCVTKALLTFVDLAGSESLKKTNATGERKQEGTAINKSLSALSGVINALSEQKQHIPYRDSVLTRLLQDSLGGNSFTTLIVHCSPAQVNMDETKSTLKFAETAKKIKNKPKKTMIYSEKDFPRVIAKLEAENEELRTQLDAFKQARQAQLAGAAKRLVAEGEVEEGSAAVAAQVENGGDGEVTPTWAGGSFPEQTTGASAVPFDHNDAIADLEQEKDLCDKCLLRRLAELLDELGEQKSLVGHLRYQKSCLRKLLLEAKQARQAQAQLAGAAKRSRTPMSSETLSWDSQLVAEGEVEEGSAAVAAQVENGGDGEVTPTWAGGSFVYDAEAPVAAEVEGEEDRQQAGEEGEPAGQPTASTVPLFAAVDLLHRLQDLRDEVGELESGVDYLQSRFGLTLEQEKVDLQLRLQNVHDEVGEQKSRLEDLLSELRGLTRAASQRPQHATVNASGGHPVALQDATNISRGAKLNSASRTPTPGTPVAVASVGSVDDRRRVSASPRPEGRGVTGVEREADEDTADVLPRGKPRLE